MEKLKFNPFRPNSIVTPGMFQGRFNELIKVQDCLFQARYGNPQHFLIQGERGIGKSSLLFAIEAIARGQLVLRDEKLKFIVVSLELTSSMSHQDILRKLASALAVEIKAQNKFKEIVKFSLAFLAKFEALGVQFHKDTKNETENFEIVEEISEGITEFFREVKTEFDGILFLLDEADKPSVSAHLGESIKLLTERLTKKGCDRVVVGLAGLPTLLETLKLSHESSPRLFSILSLNPLEDSEIKAVIQKGLDEVETKTKVKIGLAPEAADFLSDLCDGYPHFLQQFAYSAFEEDSDFFINIEDVRKGAFKEHGALDQLGDKYFYDLYNSVNSDDYRSVLQSLAAGLTEWRSRTEIILKSGLKEGTVDNALKSLKLKGAVISNDAKKGEYKLPTKSFAVWIKATAEKDLLSKKNNEKF